mgnify:CR=1 FL=1
MQPIPLILLPGMMCDSRMYASQMLALADLAECRVGNIGGANNMADIAAQVLVQAPDKFALAGLSMGGIVAMEIIRQAPERVTRLALMDTNPRAEEDTVKMTRQPQIEAVRAGQLEPLLRETMAPRYFTTQEAHKQFDQLCVDMALSLGKDVFERQSLALKNRRDQRETLARFDKPCLVLMGEADDICPLEMHECMVTLLSNVAFVKIHNAAHIPTLEQPAATSAALRQWMVQK